MRRGVVAPFLWVCLAVCAWLLPGLATAQDLLVAGDEDHLWLVVESAGAEGEQIELYHRAATDDPAQMHALEPIPGRLRPGGIAAGDGRLILIMDDGQVLTRSPYKEPMGWDWSYRAGTLAPLPEGCGLRSLVANERGVWALVRVDVAEVLVDLDAPPRRAGASRVHDDRLNAALGLPPGVELPGRGGADRDAPSDEETIDEDADETDAPANEASEDAATQTETDAQTEPDAAIEPDVNVEPDVIVEPEVNVEPEETVAREAAPTVPVYRLIRLGERGWRTIALPAGFGLPSNAALVLRGAQDARPAVVSEVSHRGELVVSLPVGEQDWAQQTYYLPGRQRWSVASLSGQVFVAMERHRDAQQVVVDVYLLRGHRRASAAVMWVNTLGTARWRLLGLGSQAVLLARANDGPMANPNANSNTDQGDSPVLLVGEYRLPAALLGAPPPPEGSAPHGKHTDFYPATRTRWENNADWIIQILALTAAMVTLMLFWKRTPRSQEVALPKHIHLVPWSRRLLSTMIDLMPGLWIAGALYGLGWDEIVLAHWPGTPISKPPEAMWPGWLVIAVTVFHTTVFEFITARSPGKWLTGIYVSDFRGVPAPPGASLVRALSRVFELVAWLMLLLPLISPHRQRLGDILARTLVVYRDDPESSEDGHSDLDD